MGPTGDEYRVVQIHPSQRCNLRCLHCYSLSGPQRSEELPSDLLRQAIVDLQAEGYNALGVSGGEPLLYGGLSAVLEQARELGMITTVTTNGMLLTRRRIQGLAGLVDLVAISLDGLPDEHNRMRASPKAFETMASRLADVRGAGLRFGFIFTLTLHNLDQLEQVAAFAAEQGASMLQVHPLEEVGRAREELLRHAPDDLELSYAFIEVARLQKHYRGTMRIQYDVLDRKVVREDPQRVFAVGPQAIDDWSDRPLAELVSPLIVETDGTVVPIQYGFSRNFAVGNLTCARLREQAAQWRKEVYPAFLRLCSDVYNDVMTSSSDNMPFTNWYGRITQGSALGVTGA